MLIFQGALRNAIATFVHASPTLKDTIWSLLEQYDLPVVVGPPAGNTVQPISPVSFLSHFFSKYSFRIFAVVGLLVWHEFYSLFDAKTYFHISIFPLFPFFGNNEN